MEALFLALGSDGGEGGGRRLVVLSPSLFFRCQARLAKGSSQSKVPQPGLGCTYERVSDAEDGDGGAIESVAARAAHITPTRPRLKWNPPRRSWLRATGELLRTDSADGISSEASGASHFVGV